MSPHSVVNDHSACWTTGVESADSLNGSVTPTAGKSIAEMINYF